MNDIVSWQYNEYKQVGKDYSQPDEVEMYDSRHSDFRDMEKESNAVLDKLDPGKNDKLIDFGSGSGTFAIQAAFRCARVFAVDVSQPMLDLAKIKAEKAGVANIEFCRAGFLGFECGGPGVDFITTTFAFHHLPDFWKGTALQNMFRLLVPGGQLYMHDVIVEERNALQNIAAFIDKLAGAGGDFLREDAEAHFREEFSTYDWVMDGLLARTGFVVESKEIRDGVIGTYFCTRN